MTPEQEAALKRLATGKGYYDTETVRAQLPEFAALAQVVLELRDAVFPLDRQRPPEQNLRDALADERFTHRRGYGPGDGPSSQVAHTLRLQMEHAVEDLSGLIAPPSILSSDERKRHARIVVDNLLDILDADPPFVSGLSIQYTDEQKHLLDVKQIAHCYRGVIQAIRRGE
jgi:hypothetical protein